MFVELEVFTLHRKHSGVFTGQKAKDLMTCVEFCLKPPKSGAGLKNISKATVFYTVPKWTFTLVPIYHKKPKLNF